MSVTVNHDLCMGCGICANVCPDCFEMKDDMKSHLIENCKCAESDCCNEAAEACPVNAIEVN